MITWKQTVTRRFDAAAATYDAGAESQRLIALSLRDEVLAQPLRPAPNVLEIGCGTGFLTQALMPNLPGCHWMATDTSPRMVEICSQRVDARITLKVMDGELPEFENPDFDLIVSSMAVQWFGNLATGLERLHALLRPGGLLAVTTLGSRTFHEWREACHSAGVEPATPHYPNVTSLESALGPSVKIHQRDWPLFCPTLRDFLNHLRITGARTAAPGQSPLSPVTLRRIIRAWDGRPFTATYDVLTLLWRKEL